MPVVKRSNNQILPANARASDVATKAISELMPAQQMKYLDAFRVQGYQGVLYNRLEQGKRCTCQSSQKALNTRLNQAGKASVGDINKLLTGVDRFDLTPYDPHPLDPEDPFSNITSPHAPENKYQGTFNLKGNSPEYNNTEVVPGKAYGDNGPVDPDNQIEDLFGDWDAANLGFTDVACACCFGTGFVGGFAPFHANRQVFAVNDRQVTLTDTCDINELEQPWVANSKEFYVQAILPLGAIGIDVIRVMNGTDVVGATMEIDGVLVTNIPQTLKYCDGRMHVIHVVFTDNVDWTHFEMQFNLTHESAYFEFPKLRKGSDLSRLEQLEPFQIVMSPNIPSLRTNDIVVESTFGKVLVVQNSDWWNTRNRNVLGWECTVRVIEPTEKYRILPFRGRVKSKNVTTNIQHDNVRGSYRT